MDCDDGYDDDGGPDDVIDGDLLDDDDGVFGDPDYGEALCPSCGALIAEETQKCPHCGDWIVPQGEAGKRSRTWFWPIIIVLMILGLIMLFT